MKLESKALINAEGNRGEVNGIGVSGVTGKAKMEGTTTRDDRRKNKELHERRRVKNKGRGMHRGME